MSLSNIDILIPAYRAIDDLKECLVGVEQYYPERGLTLVYDCGGEPMFSFLKEYEQTHKQTQVLWRQSRGWFTRAINTGMRFLLANSTKEWIVALNADVVIGEGAIEELIDVWHTVEAERKVPVGLVGNEGAGLQPPHPRYTEKWDPGFVTGHALLMSTALMREKNWIFPQYNGEVAGFSEADLCHINSDRALSYRFNRNGYNTVISHASAIGHKGGRDWGHCLADVFAINPRTLQD